MDIPFHKPSIGREEITAVSQCLKEGWLTFGKRTLEFENLFAAETGSLFASAVSSGTAALHLALCCIGLKPGDKVIVPAFTFVSTAETVRYLGAEPVFADIDFATHLIDVSKLEEKITPDVKAIIPVHYGGQPCDMDEIMKIAEKHSLFVIEDAAHSLPASYKNRKAGAIGHAGCFSFYATKTLTTGEGGMVVTDNEEWALKIRSLRLHGISKDAWKRYSNEGTWRYDVLMNGFKYNMTDIASAIGIEQLKKLNLMNAKRRVIADRYTAAFSDINGLLPYHEKEDRKSSCHLYPLKIDSSEFGISRDYLAERLKEKGIMTSVHFIPLYRFSAYKDAWQTEDFPVCEKVFSMELSLPIYPDLLPSEQDRIINAVIDEAR